MIKVRVPATSANMGPGFDSLGIAVALYNTVTIEEIPYGIITENYRTKEYIPQGENNLIYRAMKMVFDRVGYIPKGIKIIQDSEIPMTRGLGSSSACIIAGLLGANVMSGRKLSYAQILDLATEMEGHPDNVAPALYGGFCASVRDGNKVITKSVKIDKPIMFEVMIPEFYQSTKKSRVKLPQKVLHTDAAFNAGNTALLALALQTGDFGKLKVSVRDRLHQPYRSANIGNMQDIFDESYQNGAYAVWLSGSGPTIIALRDAENDDFSDKMNGYFRRMGFKRTCRPLTIDNVGSIVQVY